VIELRPFLRVRKKGKQLPVARSMPRRSNPTQDSHERPMPCVPSGRIARETCVGSHCHACSAQALESDPGSSGLP
jgi:hypothetical protein